MTHPQTNGLKTQKLIQTPKKTDLFTFDFTEQDLLDNFTDPAWRLSHLYTIVNKQKEVVVFRPNTAQKLLLAEMHYRNVILKARKLGFSTAIQILMLDTAMFSPNQRGKVIAQDLDLAQDIFRDVFKFSYDNLPGAVKEMVPLAGAPSKDSIQFVIQGGDSLVQTTVSARGTTPTFLHVSEFGKIAAKDPQKSNEIVTGSITSVAEDGLIFVESTAEGQTGDFHALVEIARKTQEMNKKLWKLDFKFFFFPWYKEPSYVAPVNSAVLTPRDVDYFSDIELRANVKITPEQRAWYVKTKSTTYLGDEEKMWQEMPSTPDEAFKVSMQGAYFTEQFSQIRKDGRICRCPYDPQYPVSTFWDIWQNDETAIWFIQAKRTHYAVIRYMEDTGEPLIHFVKQVDALGYVLGDAYLPHDAAHRRQGQYRNMTAEEMLQEIAPHWRFQLVDRTPHKQMAIQQARAVLPMCVFDEGGCASGIKHLEAYRRQWDKRAMKWRSRPHEGPEENGADAFLQFAQAKALNLFTSVGAAFVGSHALGGMYGDHEPADMGY